MTMHTPDMDIPPQLRALRSWQDLFSDAAQSS
jgi:hypothetical protein